MTDGTGSTSFPVNVWTPWESPAVWPKESLAHVPPSPGICTVRRVDPNGDPVRLPVILADPSVQATPVDLAKRAEGWQGVVYVGKAVDVQNRFALLVNSWVPNPPSKPHTSRENWDQKDAAFRAQYPPDEMQVRFKRMSNKDWAVSTLRKAYRPYAESQAGEPGWPYANTNEALDDIDSWFKA